MPPRPLAGALLVVDVNYFPSMRGMPAGALAAAVSAAAAAARERKV
jgi:hypothetical protein